HGEHSENITDPTRRSSDLHGEDGKAEKHHKKDGGLSTGTPFILFGVTHKPISFPLELQVQEGIVRIPHKVADGKHQPSHRQRVRSEKHTSELQSRFDLVCR